MHAIVSSPRASGPRIPRRSSSRARIACLSDGVTPTDPMPLHVAVPSDRQKAGVGPADHPAQQSQVGNHLHVLHSVQMMRDAHRPSDHHVAGRHVHLGDARDRLAGNPGAGFDISHVVDSTCCSNAVEALGVALDEHGRVTAALEHVFGDAGQQRKIAADVRLDVQAGDPAAEHQAPRIAGHAEVDQPDLFRRIDDDDVAAAATHGHEAAKQPRMVRRGIASDQHEEIAALDVRRAARWPCPIRGSLPDRHRSPGGSSTSSC